MSNTNIAAKTVAIKVNQDRLLANLEFSFTNKETMLGEIMQNARRAGATHVTFNYVKEGELLIGDDGKGIDDFQNLFSVAESGWDVETMQKEKPFGMGWLSCLYGSETIYVESAGHYIEGKSSEILAGAAIEVKSNGNAKKKSYTQIILTGVVLTLDELKKSLTNLAKGFSIPVYLNGEKLKSEDAVNGDFVVIDGIGSVLVPEVDFQKIHYNHGDLDSSLAVYLQGLPVYSNVMSWKNDYTVKVHLDPELFFARMPDRDILVNEKEALQKIKSAVNNVHLDRLKALKASLSSEEFAESGYARYALKIEGGFDLLCDKETRLSSIFYGNVSNQQPSCYHEQNKSTPSSVNSYSFDEVSSGKCVLFTAEEMSEDEESCAAAWILARSLGFELIDENRYWLKGHSFMAKHWAAPFIHELNSDNVKVDVFGEGKSGAVDLNWWTCKMVLCEAYKITYTDPNGKVYEAVVEDEPLLTDDGKFLVPAKVNYIADAMYQAASYYSNDDIDEQSFNEDERDINVYFEMLRSGSVIKTLENILRQVNLSSYEDLKGQKFELLIDDNLIIHLSGVQA